MVYIRMRKNNIPGLMPLAPMRILSAVDDRNSFGIVAMSDEGKTEGVLVYEIKEAGLVCISWIYVSENARGKGTGDGLMNVFFERISKKPVNEVVAEIPENENSLFAQSYFSRFGFRFERSVSYEIFRNVNVLKEIFSLGKPRVANGILPASAVSEKLIRDFLDEPGRENGRKAYKENCAAINPEVSCIHFKNRQDIDGMLLLKDDLSGLLQPVVLETGKLFIETASRLAAGCLYYAERNFSSPPDVYIRCENAKHRELIGVIFDEIHPVLIRRGILRINKKSDIEQIDHSS